MCNYDSTYVRVVNDYEISLRSLTLSRGSNFDPILAKINGNIDLTDSDKKTLFQLYNFTYSNRLKVALSSFM